MAYQPRCSGCPNTNRCLSGDGDRPSRVMFIGGRPGLDDRDKILMGRSGAEFNDNYLRLAGLSRDEIYITNTVKCCADQNRVPADAEISSCSHSFLPDEIDRCEPEFIILMGAAACSLIPDLDLEVEHGIPRQGKVFQWEGTVIPMYHPSLGMRDTGMMIPLLEDFSRLRDVLDGSYIGPEPFEEGKYCEVTDWMAAITSPINTKNAVMAIDTETYNDEPYSAQVCWNPGRAYFLRTPYGKALKEWEVSVRMGLTSHAPVHMWLQHVITAIPDMTVVLHNAPGDLDILEKVGINVPIHMVRDTMQEAYHLGNLPQGLKALAYRLLGVRMKGYLDVVMPPSRIKALDWIENAIGLVEDKYQITTLKQLKTKVKTIVSPSPMEKGLRRIFKHGCFNDGYNVWDKIKELREKEQESGPIWGDVDSTHGPVPLPGIANVGVEEQIRYGCMDADVTWQVARKLQIMRVERKLNLGVPAGDRDEPYTEQVPKAKT